MNQLLLYIQSQDNQPVVGKSSRKIINQSLGNPVASFSRPTTGQPAARTLRRNQRSIWKESIAEIESCKLPQLKGTRFVLFWEIVQLTEERFTGMERRRRISLDKRRRDLEFI
ncbi:hypothetical protein F511_39957 [Dorcoceras hygrometricum]|uniref:Uncharacterized protein n=1 Tax=Dorcoceras hygrometricum TaxID=472368 RepID=A0A2Z7DAI1_9LAMI|nr:hypothetical protein F511_39957 [Dorcoceras hygrometricum]